MRRFPISWSDTLAKLGFRRKLNKSRRQLGYSRRRPQLEMLEPRTMLSGNTYTVTTLGDEFDLSNGDAHLSSREAIYKTATDGSTTTNDTIQFDASLFASGSAAITLTYDSPTDGDTTPDQLVLNSNVTIQGPGADKLSISGNNQTRVLLVNSGVTATLSGLTITAGNSDVGGGIWTYGSLTIDHSTVSNSTAAYGGGGIYVDHTGQLSLLDSTVDGNHAGSPSIWGQGGGIAVYAGAGNVLNISGSTISHNTADGIGGL